MRYPRAPGSSKGKMTLAEATAFAERVRSVIGPCHVAGSVRRRREMIGDLDIVVVDGDLPILVKRLCSSFGPTSRVTEVGNYRSTVVIAGTQVNLWSATVDNLGAMLLYTTGSAQYSIRLRAHAKKKGFLLNQYGLWRGDVCVASATEKEICEKLGVTFRDPTNREA